MLNFVFGVLAWMALWMAIDIPEKKYPVLRTIAIWAAGMGLSIYGSMMPHVTF